MDDVQTDVTPSPEGQPAESSASETAAEAKPMAAQAVEAPPAEKPKEQARPEGGRREGQRGQQGGQQSGQQGQRPPRPEGRGGGERGGNERREGQGRGGNDRGERGDRGDRDKRGDRREGRPGGGRPFEGTAEIELEKLISDSLYLDNQAHAVVIRMRDMDSGTKSQLRRLYNAVRRAVRAPESERQHEFVMLRARLAYTIARHSLRSLDALERLLLQVTRKNDARGYERFKDLFEAIVAYNE